MALFNRKKGDAPESAAPVAGAQPVAGAPKTSSSTDSFDFDAISRDLDAQGGASSFDSLLAAPAATNAQTPTDSAFDFPETDPLGLNAPPANARPIMVPPALAPNPGAPVPTATALPVQSAPETVINAPMQPATVTGLVPTETVTIAPDVRPNVTRLKGKKAMPLIPILGALGLLAVAGGVGTFLLNSNKSAPEEEAPIVSLRPRIAKNPAAPAPAVAPGLRSAAPGIAPPVLPTARPQAAAATPARGPGLAARPAAKATSSVLAPALDTSLALKLKALWQAGAEAKHKGDLPAARAAWTKALRLRPGHPGFQESINKLPR